MHTNPQSVAVNLDSSNQSSKALSNKDVRGTLPYPNKKDNPMESLYTSLLGQKRKTYFMNISRLYLDFKHVLSNQQCKKVFYLFTFLVVSTLFTLSTCLESNSSALMTYMYISLLDLSILCTCLLSIWVEQQRSNSTFSFGYGRFEVLAVFSCTVAALLGSLFILKDCMVKFFSDQQPTYDGSKMILGVIIVFFTRLTMITFTDSKAWSHVINSSRSNLLQTRLTKMSDSLCQIVPGLSRFLLPRLNPFILLTYLGACVILLAHLIIELKGYQTADTLATMCLAVFILITIYPMFKYTGLILLQAVPSHITDQLEKCLRETATLDGILEFRNEHFWTASFGVVAGSLHVRVRRDANEQLVLAQVTNRLSSFASVLTIQVFKDDWTRATSLQLLNESARNSYASLSSSFSTTSTNYQPSIFHPEITNGAAANKHGSSISIAPSTVTLSSVPYTPLRDNPSQQNRKLSPSSTSTHHMN
ncbi:hypothetical protein CHUAL_004312 [Chamberlinius hualienensis]